MRFRVAPLAALLVLACVVPAHSNVVAQRTLLLSTAVDGTPADGPSSAPAVAADGSVIAFTTSASNLGALDAKGSVTGVVAIDVRDGTRRTVSSQLLGTPADGASGEAAISADGTAVAFSSDATNLVAGDTNGQGDVFVAYADGPPQLVSAAADGGPADGTSYEPDISANGRFIVFTSTATNLVSPPTSGQPEVFIRDAATGTTALVSTAVGSAVPNGRSNAPAISPDGGFVTFTSGASNLVNGDTNGVTDVFLANLATGALDRVSVSTSSRQQDKSIDPPFGQVSDVSSGGRFVVFDSAATTLYRHDTNQRSDVWLRDRRRKTTTLVSVNSLDVEGDNDSYGPRISADGHLVSFASLASNLAAPESPREDLFIRDLRLQTTSAITVSASGAAHGAEPDSAVLRRPAVTDDGRVASFASAASGLTGAQTVQSEVYVRRLDAPVLRLVSAPKPGTAGTVLLAADDPAATRHVCRFDGHAPFACGPRIHVRPGDGHLLAVRGGGPGMLASADLLRVRLSYDLSAPALSHLKLHDRRLTGQARDPSGVASVEVGLVVAGIGGCRFLTRDGNLSGKTAAACRKVVLVPAKGTIAWRRALPSAIHGSYAIYARATDRLGNVGTLAVRRGVAP